MPKIPRHVQQAFEARGHRWLERTERDEEEGLAYLCHVAGLRYPEQWVCHATIAYLAGVETRLQEVMF